MQRKHILLHPIYAIILLVAALVCPKHIFAAPISPNSIQTHVVSPEDECNFTPWYTGSLLEPSSTNQDPGTVNLQPYFFYGVNYGQYDNNWSLGQIKNYSFLISNIIIEIGVTKHFQLQLTPQTQSTFFKGKTSSHFSDLIVGAAFQFLWDEKGKSMPNLRVIISEVFPTGKYDFLDPFFDGNNATGRGAYATVLTLDISKIIYTIPCHPVYVNASFDLTYATSARTRGVSFYGGSPNTNGKVSGGFGLLADLSFEYSMTKRWVFACDLQYIHDFQGSFSGNPGTNELGERAEIDTRSSSLLTISPAIEYNIMQNLGVIFGGVFSYAGKNIPATAQAVGSITYTF